MVFALILALAFAIVMVFFALENPALVTVNFFGYGVEGSLALFILIAVGIGLLVGVLIMLPGRIKSSLSNARSRKKIGELETSLDEHKTQLSAMDKLVKSASPPEFESIEDK
jgi:putative membrane protein